MTGAESLIRTLLDGGVDTCFMNPGTSEIHFVSALDTHPEMKSILCLFEGVVTGCADGYARMAGKPAASLLHLGPGLGNGIANLHNAKKAFMPMVNIVGQHAMRHLDYDAPLSCDIEGLARPVSGWVKTTTDSKLVAQDGAAAIAASQSPPGQVATLILPADTAWNEAHGPAKPKPIQKPNNIPGGRISEIATIIRTKNNVVLLVGDHVLRSEKLQRITSSISKKFGARFMAKWFGARIERGAGRPIIERLAYFVDQSLEILKDTEHLVLIGTVEPVGFFAYPNKPSLLAPPASEKHVFANIDDDVEAGLLALAAELEVSDDPGELAMLERHALPSGKLDPDKIWKSLTALMPENSIISDEGITASRIAGPLTQNAPAHDWLHVTGGAIGQGLPVATGAAVACPDRQVFAMEADGSGMYTLQALWTQARESLNVVTVIFANRTYKILQAEMKSLCDKEDGPQSSAMMELNNPNLDWVQLSQGMGVPAVSVDTAEAFNEALKRGIAEPGPFLIEAVV
ncbi:MAG: acetolactate synthase large subunit [Verrucomicrobia bacterium]|nr:acetolactate synthase large subunit [Verrucomicrobiota bacterium]MDA1065523.1 acetolactate synthase large subunit [Verrucomicrobiota bacterium]